MVRSVEERAALAVGWYQLRYLCMLADVCVQQGDLRAAAEFLQGELPNVGPVLVGTPQLPVQLALDHDRMFVY